MVEIAHLAHRICRCGASPRCDGSARPGWSRSHTWSVEAIIEGRSSSARVRSVVFMVAVAVLLIGIATALGFAPYLSTQRVRLNVPHTCPPPVATVFGRTWQADNLAPPSWVPSVRGVFTILSFNAASFTADGHLGSLEFRPAHGSQKWSCPLQ